MLNHWFTILNHRFTTLNQWFTTLKHWFRIIPQAGIFCFLVFWLLKQFFTSLECWNNLRAGRATRAGVFPFFLYIHVWPQRAWGDMGTAMMSPQPFCMTGTSPRCPLLWHFQPTEATVYLPGSNLLLLWWTELCRSTLSLCLQRKIGFYSDLSKNFGSFDREL